MVDLFLSKLVVTPRSTEEVERVVQVPSLGVVPHYLNGRRKRTNGDLTARFRGWLPGVKNPRAAFAFLPGAMVF
jgi:hypothetical protein